MGTSGGNHAQCLDIGEHVTRTFEGSGTSATRTCLADVVPAPFFNRAWIASRRAVASTNSPFFANSLTCPIWSLICAATGVPVRVEPARAAFGNITPGELKASNPV